MARKMRLPPGEELETTSSLLVPRATVEEKLKERIEKGKSLQMRDVRTERDLTEARAEQRKWHEYNIDYLARCFDSRSISNSYAQQQGLGLTFIDHSLNQRLEVFRDRVRDQINRLESILERLELIPETTSTLVTARRSGDSVFVVHGSDEASKVQVARFLEKLGLNVVILHEQPNQGQTIIEKLEGNAAGAGYAVVLLTPDDIAAPGHSPDARQSRARQNVILELGYFCGALGRDRVCVLYKKGVEIPTDYLGVLYTPLDDGGGWQIELARELKTSGLPVDLNDVV